MVSFLDPIDVSSHWYTCDPASCDRAVEGVDGDPSSPPLGPEASPSRQRALGLQSFLEVEKDWDFFRLVTFRWVNSNFVLGFAGLLYTADREPVRL